MNFSAPFIQRPVMTTFVMLTLLIAGWLSFSQLPVSDLPTIERPRIQVMAGYTGANPEYILNQLTIPLEKELTHVKGVEEMSSTSSAGSTLITLDFDLSKNMDQAIRDVQSALNRADAKLPSEVDPRPFYTRQEGGQEMIMHLLLMSKDGNVGELRNYADAYLVPKLSRIEGIAQVQVFGSSNSIWLRLNPELMAARNIGFNEVIETVRKHTVQVPLGTIQTSSKLFSLEIPNTNRQPKELGSMLIGNTGVRLRDIGEVSTQSENDGEFYLVTPEQRTQTIILGIQKVNDANTVAIAKAVEAVVADLQKNLPPSMELKIWFNKAVWIQESILDVEWSLFFAFLLVILVIYLSLGRFSEALIPSAALPMSLIGTFIAMYLLDFSLDLLSLLALTLSVGFVVDDAIVVLENIVRHQEGGKTPYQASMDGSKQICFTVLSMTLSLVAVFIPLLFMQGMNGRLFREFSLTLAISILVSGFISLSLTPMLCRLFLPKQHTATQTKVQQVISGLNTKLVSLYNRSLRVCLNYRKTVLAFAFVVIALAVPLFSRLPVNLIPPEDRGFIMAMVNLPNGTSASETQEYQKRLEGVVKGIPGIMDILDINYEGNIFLLVRLFPQAERRPQELVIADIRNALNKIASIQAYVQGYQLINLNLDFTGGGYKFILRGRDFDEVNEVSQELVNTLQKNPIFLSVDSSVSTDSPQLAVKVNEEYANTLGLGKNEVQKLLQNAYGQYSVGILQRGDQQQKIYMELLPDYRSSINGLNKLFLTTPKGAQVPLKAIATWEEKLGNPKLTRRDQLASAVVRFALSPEVNAGEGLKIAEDIAFSMLPSSVSGALGESARAVTSTINNTLFLLLAAAVVMYIVLGILYESFIHPLTILSSLPFAALGGVLTLFLFNEPISIFSAVGFLLLIGIVKKNGIMMIDYALEAQERGLSSLEAIIEGCLIRFRPIMMTTIAAVMGAIPIAIGFGEGAEMRRGLGLVIVGGLLFAQVLTLYVTPILYLTFDRFSRKKS